MNPKLQAHSTFLLPPRRLTLGWPGDNSSPGQWSPSACPRWDSTWLEHDRSGPGVPGQPGQWGSTQRGHGKVTFVMQQSGQSLPASACFLWSNSPPPQPWQGRVKFKVPPRRKSRAETYIISPSGNSWDPGPFEMSQQLRGKQSRYGRFPCVGQPGAHPLLPPPVLPS